MCSSFEKYYMAWEYYTKTLEIELYQKSLLPSSPSNDQYYSEPEIWYLLDSLVSVVKAFKAQGYHHGDF
jgi:hypothetical protein